MSYPKEVPVLTARDMCKGWFKKGDRRCLAGWIFECFEKRGSLSKPVWRAIQDGLGIGEGPISPTNDARTLAQNAATWNAAMRSLGYTEVS